MLRPLAALAITALLGACALPGEPVGEPADDSAPGFDLDDPAAAGDSKADQACQAELGGPLSGDDLLVLVNKQPGQQLAADWAPRDLLPIGDDLMMPGRQGDLRGPVIDALGDMIAAGREVGIELGVRSAYRSFHTQCVTFEYKVREHGIEHAKQFSAEPGRSQHQLGTTVDLTSASLGWSLEQSMGAALEGQWLAENAHLFGFALSYPEGHEDETGYAYEPWHFRYIGKAAALEAWTAELILESYLERCQAGDSAFACEREPFPEPIANEGFIGGACDSDDDCSAIGADAFCLLDGYPGGSCTLPCAIYCPDQAGLTSPTFCVGDGGASGLCHSRCDEDVYPGNGCREGYVCESATRPQGGGSALVCLPAG